MSSFLQLWNLFGNIITEFWNLTGVFMDDIRNFLCNLNGRLTELLWNNHGNALQVARVVICKR